MLLNCTFCSHYKYSIIGLEHVSQTVDFSVGDSSCQANPADQKDVLHYSDEDGDWLV